MKNNLLKLEAVRAEIADVAARRGAADATQRSRAEVRSTLKTLIKAMHEQATQQISWEISNIAFGAGADLLRSNAADHGVMGVTQLAADFQSLLAFTVGPKEILAKLEPVLVEAVPEGLSLEQRAHQQRELGDMLLALEVDEDRLCRMIDADGGTWDPRPDQNAALAIAVVPK